MDRVFSCAIFLSGGHVSCNLSHRRDVASLCKLYKIVGNWAHPVCLSLPEMFVPARVTRLSVSLHDRAFVPVRYRTDQYGRWFTDWVVGMWDTLDNTVLIDWVWSHSNLLSTLSSYLVDGFFSFFLHFVSCLVFCPADLLSCPSLADSLVF